MPDSVTPNWKAQSSLTPGVRGLAVTYSGGTFTAPATFQATGILVKTAGVIVGRLHEDSTDVTYPVIPGLLPLGFKSITEAGTTNTGAGELVLVGGKR